MNIIIRVDAGIGIGMGHFVRCLTLSDHLINYGYKIIFITNIKNNKILNNEFCEHIYISCKVSMDEELLIINKTIKDKHAQLIIMDVNNYYSYKYNYKEYQLGLRRTGILIVSFDDFKNNSDIPNLVIIPYVGAETLPLYNNNNTK